jgi:anti-sigma regulatory factor (Ser/Thr protein kinase)
MEKEITVAADREQIPVISEFIEELMASSGFDLKKIMEVLLAVEEVCTNIALYAYNGKEGTIHIAARVDAGRMNLTIEDWGVPFDPTTHSVPLSDANAEERPIGGLGILLIKSYVDGITYQFVDEKNTLKLVKNI